MHERREANDLNVVFRPAAGRFEPCSEWPEESLPREIERYRGETYYDIPSIKHSHYKWRTATAFAFNGLGGGSQVLAALVDLLGSDEDRLLVRTGRIMAFTGGIASPITLISSLHTPQRWYNMLRIFRKTSPMSIGIWAITPFSMLSGLTMAGQLAEDLGYERAGRWTGRLFAMPAAVLGSIVISYMGTELEETNMPLWASAHPLMAPLYAASGISNSTTAILTAAEVFGSSERMKKSLKTIAVVSGAIELALSSMIEGRWSRLPEAAAFDRSSFGPLFRLGVMGAGLAAPFSLRLFEAAVNGRLNRLSVPASIAKLAGGLLMQMVLVYSGKESGRRARDYFEYTRPEKLRGGNGASGLIRTGRGGSVKPKKALGQKKKRERSKPFKPSTMLGLGLLAFSLGMFAAASGGKRGEAK